MSNNKPLFGLIYYSHVRPHNYHMFTIIDAYETDQPTSVLESIDTRMNKHTHKQKNIQHFS